MTIDQIPIFERDNSDYSINVIYADEDTKKFMPLYSSEYKGRTHAVKDRLYRRTLVYNHPHRSFTDIDTDARSSGKNF